MKTVLRYLIYIISSLFLGLLSSRADVGRDYLFYISKNILPILLTLFVLYTTIFSLVLKEFSIYKSKMKMDGIKEVQKLINSLKRNFKIMLSIIGIDVLFLILYEIIPTTTNVCLLQISRIIINVCTAFSIFYFLYVIYDSINGFFNLYIENNK